ncbi:MAG: hypothetical protein HDT26_11440 [Subdoligranulum sp.]|nr:hypothetical protein [Subdoligranulum sp.]
MIIGKKGNERKAVFSHAADRRAGNRGPFDKLFAALPHRRSPFREFVHGFAGLRIRAVAPDTHFYYITRRWYGLQALFENFGRKPNFKSQISGKIAQGASIYPISFRFSHHFAGESNVCQDTDP